MTIDNFLYPNHPIRCIITGPSECGKSVYLTKLILNSINDFNKIYIYSPSLHQDLYQNLNNWFCNYIPIHIIPKILNGENIDEVIVEIVKNKHFEKSDTELETYEKLEEMKFPQIYEDGGISIPGDLNEKEMINPRVQAMFKRLRYNKLFFFIISQDYYEIPKETIRANGNIYHIFKPNNFPDVRNFYQDKTSMGMTLDESKYLNSTCWNEKYQLPTIDMTNGKYYCGLYGLGLNSIFVPDTTPF